MNAELSNNLKDYMNKKGYHHIEVELVDSGTSTCGFAELSAKFLTDKQAEGMEKKSRHVLDTELGKVYCTAVFEFDDQVTFDLRSFLGLKDITFTGIHGWRW